MKTLLQVLFLVLASSLLVVTGYSIKSLPQRVEIAKPDTSGVAAIVLQADPSDPNYSHRNHFVITHFYFVNDLQEIRLWDPTHDSCNGTLVVANKTIIPINGEICFWSNTQLVAEFENIFSFVTEDVNDNRGPVANVTVINYNIQLCTGIPDLGSAGSFSAPPLPTVNIALSGLEVQFNVTATYIRNDTTWMIDFWDFNSAPGGDSADGTGRTCCNHVPSHYPAEFPEWWWSAVRATYDSAINPTISNALNDVLYPNYDPQGSIWTIYPVDCSTVLFTATIPVSHLVRNTTSDCHYSPSLSAATTPNGLVYSGSLYVNAIRPRNYTEADAGYYKSTFIFPFSFSLQSTVSDLYSVSSKWNFDVAIETLNAAFQGGSPGLTMELQTTVFGTSLQNAPEIVNFTVLSFPTSPYESIQTTRLSDNGKCSGSDTGSCIILWKVFVPEVARSNFGTQNEYNLQYTGQYDFRWTTAAGDYLQADIFVTESAANPTTNLTQIPVPSTVDFFKSESTMQNLTNSGLGGSPEYTSGEQIWVRQSFDVSPSDVKAFIFTLKSAWVCYSSEAFFTPTLANGGTGCSQDIPGVMEAAKGQRYLLYDRSTLPGGIPNVPGNTNGALSQIWDWTLVGPTQSGWTGGQTVNTGFGINALPLVHDGQTHTWYFHLISTVSQAPSFGKRDSGLITQEYHTIVAARDSFSAYVGGNGAALESTTVLAPGSSNAGSSLHPSLFQAALNLF